MLLSNFSKIRPPYELTQEHMLEWLTAAHIQAEETANEDVREFQGKFKEKLLKVGCKPGQINRRGHILADFLHLDWEKMSVYKLKKNPSGANLADRIQIFKEHADQILEEFYSEESSPPDDLIHVTCTGYASPSAAQKLVSNKGWGLTTTVTHAYHMGCYGALAAIRIARGFLTSDEEKKRTDIVHTEICSLHSNPSLHAADQLVSESLFADGFIKYRAGKKADDCHLKLLSIKEEIIPGSLNAMTWDVSYWGFQMTLAKEVPVFITRALKGYLERLAKKAGLEREDLCKNALFAIHPGGPKIISHIQAILELNDSQLSHTNQILQSHGNMSSATLPHIWMEIVNDGTISDRTPIVSLAFGPGLSISGAILEKRCGN